MLRCVNVSKASSGFVLITALLYLAVITLVVSYALNSSLLQIKISGNAISQAWALENAESALITGENAIEISMEQGAGQFNSDSEYSFIKLAKQECAASYYQVDALGQKGKTQIKLQSVVLVPLANQDNCTTKYTNKKRLTWLSS